MQRKNKIIKNKKVQITIFVIIAIVLVVSIALIFIFVQKPSIKISPENPGTIKSYIEKCARDATEEAEKLVIPQGGFLEPSSYLLYNDTKVAWLCYTPFNKQLCSNRHPMLNKEIEKEIENYIKPKIEGCFNDIKTKLKNYDYKEELLSIDVEILSKNIYVNMTKKITYTKYDRTISLENFDAQIKSPVYDFIRLATEIVNQEVSCDCTRETCNADVIALNRLNRDFEISRFITGRNEKIYTIKDILTNKKFNFAVRNCVRLP
jgi:hypothetical protein